MPWSHPAPRMRELILAIRAIWDTWLNGTPLQFRGEFYTHTLMTPFFTPDAADLDGFGVPKIFLAGVGELMTEVAGEVCDGFLCHGFTTEQYLREVTSRRSSGAGQGRQDDGRASRSSARASSSPAPTTRSSTPRPTGTRQQIAFYGSTPAYRRCSSCTAGAGCRTSSTRCRSRASGCRWAS